MAGATEYSSAGKGNRHLPNGKESRDSKEKNRKLNLFYIKEGGTSSSTALYKTIRFVGVWWGGGKAEE